MYEISSMFACIPVHCLAMQTKSAALHRVCVGNKQQAGELGAQQAYRIAHSINCSKGILQKKPVIMSDFQKQT